MNGFIRAEINVVEDQKGNPTYASDLALGVSFLSTVTALLVCVVRWYTTIAVACMVSFPSGVSSEKSELSAAKKMNSFF